MEKNIEKEVLTAAPEVIEEVSEITTDTSKKGLGVVVIIGAVAALGYATYKLIKRVKSKNTDAVENVEEAAEETDIHVVSEDKTEKKTK